MKRLFIGTIAIVMTPVMLCAQAGSNAFDSIYRLIKEKNFFRALEVYDARKADLTPAYRDFTEAILDNAFNRLEESDRKLSGLIKGKKNALPDSLLLELLNIRIDNAVKLYDYATAREASEVVLSRYISLLPEEEAADTKNSLKIWKALEQEGKQRVFKKGDTRLKMTKDKAGLNNLRLTADTAALDFIFDTGANISTITASAAKRFKLKIIPVNIEVGTITGTKVQAQLGVCSKMKLGDIEIHNAIFLVMEDKALAFPQIEYQIQGILGFPVIDGLGEIQLTKDGFFVVPEKETTIISKSNMAMDGLTPLIYADEMHFTFDTGADETILYERYYKEHRQRVDSTYPSSMVAFGGAGGQTTVEGYKITTTINILDKKALLKEISLLKKSVKTKESVYGNIGQDVIRQFDKMTINFDHMFIRFE